MQKRYVIVVAGGTGSRMKNALPKQFLTLLDRPVLMHTLDCFWKSESNPEIVVVLNPKMEDYWKQLCKSFNFTVPHTVVFGGDSRFQSVNNGLNFILEKEKKSLEEVVVAIHDGARPIVNSKLIKQCFEDTATYGATVTAVKSVNSIRFGNEDKSKSIEREHVWIVQTPQTFKADILRKAFLQEECQSFTDDASVVEKLGYSVHIIEGDYQNIKITFPEDIRIAQLYLENA
ncbi:2-C-methyl-D-erythritol 4-phosphate cytidylyltransferase [Sphingobacterium sp. LRF_L2]|uniref:2-C-methyl-D-erythritol 4-phosphate cytidylyltransferase n=1 Tax=Sphingobacterium sp. LRF_L2 TaxID=3369421 RepID=UPI003F5EF9D0